jgi:starch synthase
MNVLFAASECVPFASTGGLGDVAASLPKALVQLGARVTRVMPYYRAVREGRHAVETLPLSLEIPIGRGVRRAEFARLERDGVTTYFVVRDEYFDRSHLYALPHRAYEDNFERYLFFQKAVVGLIDALGLAPDILHANDWQTALLPYFLRHGIHGRGRAGGERTVFTVHNLAYQGVFPSEDFALANLPPSLFSLRGLEFFGQLNCLKGALYAADAITTVSRTYAREIQAPDLGCGLDGVIRERAGDLHGIVNGIDYDTWDPARDPRLPFHYRSGDLAGKARCRAQLCARVGFPDDRDALLIGMVSRLTEQKGFDLLRTAMAGVMDRPVRLVFLGSGEARYQDLCLEWQRRWPERVHASIAFDQDLAHWIEAGADAFLMPSRYEPCGLNQLYSLRYGTPPIVSRTGGLLDTVEPVTSLADARRAGTGFHLSEYTAAGLHAALDLALEVYRQPKVWAALQRRAMEQDFSWDSTAREYLAVYRQLVQPAPGQWPVA